MHLRVLCIHSRITKLLLQNGLAFHKVFRKRWTAKKLPYDWLSNVTMQMGNNLTNKKTSLECVHPFSLPCRNQTFNQCISLPSTQKNSTVTPKTNCQQLNRVKVCVQALCKKWKPYNKIKGFLGQKHLGIFGGTNRPNMKPCWNLVKEAAQAKSNCVHARNY